MFTYNDLVALGDDEEKRKQFILAAISEHKGSKEYEWAEDAEEYMKQQNTTITKYQKFLRTLSGKSVPDNYSANHKTASNFLKRFVTQEHQYVLKNGITFRKDETKKRMGGASFDSAMREAGRSALVGGEAYCFWNLDRVEVFKLREFKALLDEEDGAVKAGIRFWQLDRSRPIRATLYEMDGYTEFISTEKGELEIIQDKTPYKLKVRESKADGIEIYDGENYPSFPIVPLWGNPEHQSELVGLKTEIDAYDLIKSGFANDLDDISQIYWIIHNAGGMDEEDLVEFLDRLKRLRAATLEDDGATAEAHQQEVPYQSRETYLTRLENDMYYDAMAMNAKDITAGNVTATAIRAAYDNLDQKAGEFQEELEKCIFKLMELAGVEDDAPKFKLNRISNDSETTQNVLAAAQYLDRRTILEKLPFIEPEEIDDILDRLDEEELERYQPQTNEEEELNENVPGDETGGAAE